jgi:NADP-dependent 3-hydroxy acid dehydrogenase YdfG
LIKEVSPSSVHRRRRNFLDQRGLARPGPRVPRVLAGQRRLAGAVAAAVEAVHAAFGPVDLLVNAAGVMLPNPITDGRLDEWQRMIDLNVIGLLRVTAIGPLAADDIADLVGFVASRPRAVNLRQIVVLPTRQG